MIALFSQLWVMIIVKEEVSMFLSRNTTSLTFLRVYHSQKIQEYTHYLPQRPFSGAHEDSESWFTYDQFEFLYHWAPRKDHDMATTNSVWGGVEACILLYVLGTVAGVVAALGGIPTMPYSYEFAASVSLFLYLFRFLALVEMFTNHSYLFALLGFLMILSGGGSYFPPPTSTPPTDRARLIQRSEWGALLIRIQYAVVYFFASIWKTTPDWLDGTICKNIFTSFEEQDVSRGVPWNMLYEEFGPPLFRLVALGGLLLDSGMFLALALRRPDPKTTKLFSILSVMFHGFVCFTMSQRIGYTFPTCCLAGSLIFQPIGSSEGNTRVASVKEESYARSKKDDDSPATNNDSADTKTRHGSQHLVVSSSGRSDEANLIGWIVRFATGDEKARASKVQRYFALFWFAFQMAMPLRMPIITRGAFRFSGRCYRFSWTMMLHSKNAILAHSGYLPDKTGAPSNQQFFIPIDMVQLFPECADVVPLMRNTYATASVFRHADPRTIPMLSENNGIIGARQRALLEQFPRYIARVAGGWSDVLYHKVPEACHNKAQNEMRRVSVYGVVYTKLNNKGAFCRLFDPGVNLALAEQARVERSFWETFKGVLLDLGPPGYEYMLIEGIGSMNSKVEGHRKTLQELYPDVKRIEFVADRTLCLASRSLPLWPGGYPMAAVALEVPEGVTLSMSQRQLPQGTAPDKQWENLSDPETSELPLDVLVSGGASMIEFKTSVSPSASFKKCGLTTEEDILFALLFLA